LKTFESRLPIYDIPQTTVNIPNTLKGVQNIILTSADIQENPELSAFLNKLTDAVFLKAGLTVETAYLKPGEVFSTRDLEESRPVCILVFGLKPPDLCLQGFGSLHEVYGWKNFKILFAEALGQYLQNEAAKKILWASIKVLLEK
jgi:hypothetical protein